MGNQAKECTPPSPPSLMPSPMEVVHWTPWGCTPYPIAWQQLWCQARTMSNLRYLTASAYGAEVCRGMSDEPMLKARLEPYMALVSFGLGWIQRFDKQEKEIAGLPGIQKSQECYRSTSPKGRLKLFGRYLKTASSLETECIAPWQRTSCRRALSAWRNRRSIGRGGSESVQFSRIVLGLSSRFDARAVRVTRNEGETRGMGMECSWRCVPHPETTLHVTWRGK